MKLDPKSYRVFVGMDHRLVRFHRRRKNATIQAIPGKKDKNPQPSLNLRENFSMIFGTINVEARRINLRFN